MSRSPMIRAAILAAALLMPSAGAFAGPQDAEGTIPAFRIERGGLELARPALPGTPFTKAGRRFALLGFESGGFEAWAYPLKLLRNFEFSFLLGASTVPIEGRDIVRFVSAQPAVTTLTYTYQSFTVKAHYVAPVEDAGAVILLEIDSTEPLTVVCGFLPVLQPMWPAGIGGQYAHWDRELKAYLISEPTRKNHGYIGSPAARGISYTPAHMLSDVPNQFKIEIAEPRSVAGRLIPIVVAGGKGSRDEVRKTYARLAADPEAAYRRAVAHFDGLRASTLRIATPEKAVDLAFEWAKVALDGLVVDNPDLGKGLVAGLGPSGTGGRPGFGWFFGTDAYLNSLSLNSANAYDVSREALDFTRKWQRKDGKMAHELSQAAGYLRWWEDYPYGYIHGDTTPYYIVAVEDHYRMTGDLAFVKTSWPSLVKAFEWCLTTDQDGDGLMDNSKAGLGALEFGALTGIQTDIYLGAVWVRACLAMRDLAAAVGDRALSKRAADHAARASAAWDRRFWDAENRQYSYAFNKDGRLVTESTPWSAVGLAWGLGDRGRAAETLARLNSSDMTTDWGVRMLSVSSPLFEPLNYNYGAVWPFLTGWVAAALLEHNFIPQGYHVLMSNVRHTFDNALGTIMELFSGHQNTWPQEGVPHQGFSSTGVVLPLVRGLLGLDGNAPAREVFFRPRLPAGWPRVSLENWRIGRAVLGVDHAREDGAVVLRVRSEKAEGFTFVFAPALGLGTKVLAAKLNGAPIAFSGGEAPAGAQAVQPQLAFALSGDDTLVLEIAPAPEIVPPGAATATGEPDRGLKIIRQSLEGRDLSVWVEGLSGNSYVLDVMHADRVEDVDGAKLDGSRIRVNLPPGQAGFVSGRFTVRFKPAGR
jgi:glycogen debranching enzyme